MIVYTCRRVKLPEVNVVSYTLIIILVTLLLKQRPISFNVSEIFMKWEKTWESGNSRTFL